MPNDINGTISGTVALRGMSGTLSQQGGINGKLSGEHRLKGTISIGAGVEKDVPIYDGEYEVTPKVYGQSLETTGKKMLNDVVIRSIPYYETSNPWGNTVYIGSEV